MSHPEGLKIALQLIAEEAKAKTGRLDLVRLGLSVIPREIASLTHLRELLLGHAVVEDKSIGHDMADNTVSDLSPLSGLQSLNSLNCSHIPVSDLSPLSGLQSLNSLNCSKTRVRDLLPISNLKSLSRLDCQAIQVSDLSPLSNLPRLSTLFCSHIQATDLSPLANLKSLHSLVCTNTAVSDLSPLANLQSLNALCCDETQVSDLSPLADLQSLNQLSCFHTPVSNLSPLAGLQSLAHLNCGFTTVCDLSPLAQLKRLNSLNCSLTNVSDLSPLADLKNLNTLLCQSTQVSDLSPLANLTCLNCLICGCTPVSDLSPLVNLKSLDTLFFSRTHVSDLSPLADLQSLKFLDFCATQVSDLSPLLKMRAQKVYASGCKIAELPQGLLDHPTLTELILHKTKLGAVPPEILSENGYTNCLPTLRSHFADLAKGSEAVPDVKTVVVGNGRIGKTQICRRLRDEDFDESVNSTHGITVTQTPLPVDKDEPPVLLNLWDFGGQDLYHGSHSLFMKTRAVFVVVWVPHAESSIDYEHNEIRFRNHPLPYWLDYVRNVAGDVCPLIVVQNQCDVAADECQQLPAELPAALYAQTVQYSAKEDRRRKSLNEALLEAVRHLRKHEGVTTIGKGRAKVRRQILKWIDADARQEDPAKRRHRLLNYDDFVKLCERKKDVSSPAHLLDYLHNAGVVFYREGLFNNQIILDQSWALDAIYTVFHRETCYRQLKILKGRFTAGLLKALVWQKYSDSEQQLFLSFMESCGVCFKHREHRTFGESDGLDTEYVAPDLLPEYSEIEHELAGRWTKQAVGTLQRCWRFDFLNPSLVRSIISAIGSAAGESAVYWKYGLWTYETKTASAAFLEQHMDNDRAGHITLECQGGRAEELLNRLTELVSHCLHSSGYKDVVMEGLPVRDLRTGKHHLPFNDDAPNDLPTDNPTASLNFGSVPRPTTEKLACVSYAWGEENSDDPERGKKVEEFCGLLTSNGFQIIRDTTHVKIGDRLSTFMRDMIGNSDRVYVFLSDAYLKSPNCMYELLTIWQRSADDADKFLSRVKVLTMPGTDIFSIPARLKYAAYWDKQREEIKAVVEEHGSDLLGETDFKRYRNIIAFSHHVSEMLAQIVDVLMPGSFDEYVAKAEADFSESPPPTHSSRRKRDKDSRSYLGATGERKTPGNR